MEIIFDVMGSALVAELIGELDHHAAEGVRNRIDGAMRNYRKQNLIFDFSKVTFMDSSGVGVILGRYRKLEAQGSKIAIVNCAQAIRNILNMAGVFSIIDYFSTIEEAAAVFDGKEVS